MIIPPFLVAVVVYLFPTVYFDKQGNSYQDVVFECNNQYKIISVNKSRVYIIKKDGKEVDSKDTVGWDGDREVLSIDAGLFHLHDSIPFNVIDATFGWDNSPDATVTEVEADNDDDQ